MKGQVEINTKLIQENVVEFIKESINPLFYSIEFIQKFIKAAKDLKEENNEVLNGTFEMNPNVLSCMIHKVANALVLQRQFTSTDQVIKTVGPEKMLSLVDEYLDENTIIIPYSCHILIIDFREGGKFNAPKPSILLRSNQQYVMPIRRFKIYVKESERSYDAFKNKHLVELIKDLILSSPSGYIDISAEANSLTLIKSKTSASSYRELFKEVCKEIKNSISSDLAFTGNIRYEYVKASTNMKYEINELGEGDNKTYLALLKYNSSEL